MNFEHAGDSHKHSLQTLNQLFEYDDFMASIKTVVDFGCADGRDLEWWATRTTRDIKPQPLNIQCTGIDLSPQSTITYDLPNVKYHSADFETSIPCNKEGFDILWCHDSFQYALSPVQTLSNWWHLASPGAMLYIGVPLTQRIHRKQLDYYVPSHSYYHYSMVNLMYMLATAGWDCDSGFFKQMPLDPWLHAIVYKSNHKPLDPKTTTWYQLSELNLVPKTARESIQAHGYLRQQDLVVPWIDQNLISMGIK
jgi:SAM-dependent methyltransferase